MENVALPPFRLDPTRQSRDGIQQMLPCLRDLFPNIDFVERPRFDLIPTAGAKQRYVSRPTRGTWPIDDAGIKSGGPTSATLALDHLSLYDSPTPPSSSRLLPNEWSCLDTSSPDLLTSVNPSGVTGPPNCSFDILRPNRYSARLEHIASSRTQWTSIPRFTPNCDPQGMNALSQIGTTSFGTDNQSRRSNDIITAPHMSCHLPGASSLTNNIAVNSTDPYAAANSARTDSAQAQADFEAEIVKSNPRKSRKRWSQQLNPISFTGGLPSPPLSSSPSPISPITDKTLSNPMAWTGQDGSRTSPPRRKKPCDIERNHVCPRCGRAFNRPSSLRMHGRTHTGFRPFVCPFDRCGRGFSVSSNMRRHYRTHCSDGAEEEFA